MMRHLATHSRPVETDAKLVDTDPVRYVESVSNYRGTGAISLYQPLPSEGLMVFQKALQGGYTVSDRYISGSFILLPRHVFLWNVSEPGDIVPQSLTFATHTFPQLEGIIVGCGELNSPVREKQIQHFCSARGLKCHFAPTHAALMKWNVHMEDRRNIIGFFIGKKPWEGTGSLSPKFASPARSPDMDINLGAGQAPLQDPYTSQRFKQQDATLYMDSGGGAGFSSTMHGANVGDGRGTNVRSVYPSS